MRRPLIAGLLTIWMAVGIFTVSFAAPAGAGDAPATTDPAAAESTVSTTALPPAPDIIPKPNSGVAPTDAGDRGGGLQTALFFLVIGSTAFIALLVWRESKRARAERGF